MNECPASPATQDAAQETHFFLAPLRILRRWAQLKVGRGWEHSIQDSELIRGPQILLTCFVDAIKKLPATAWDSVPCGPLPTGSQSPLILCVLHPPPQVGSSNATLQTVSASLYRWLMSTYRKLDQLCRIGRRHINLNNSGNFPWEALSTSMVCRIERRHTVLRISPQRRNKRCGHYKNKETNEL